MSKRETSLAYSIKDKKIVVLDKKISLSDIENDNIGEFNGYIFRAEFPSVSEFMKVVSDLKNSR